MSNLKQTVQEMYAAFGRGDIPAILANLADDVVWESEGPEILKASGIRRGKAETIGFFDGLSAQNSDAKLTISELVESGDTLVAIGRYSATMKATGKKFDTPIAHVWKFRDGKVTRYVGFSNTAAGIEALQPLSTAAKG